MTTTETTAGRHLTKQQARGEFYAARYNEQELYPAAVRHYDANGTWPGEYLDARHKTARAFERYVDAGVCSGITVED